MHSLDSLVHICHQERVMKMVQTRTEERTRLLKCGHTPLNQEFRKYGIDSKLRRKLPYIISISAFTKFPYLFYRHILQRYGFCFKNPKQILNYIVNIVISIFPDLYPAGSSCV